MLRQWTLHAENEVIVQLGGVETIKEKGRSKR